MDFGTLPQSVQGYMENPYAAKSDEGEWLPGQISVDFLNEHFGQYDTADEMMAATDSEGLRLFFQYLKDKGLLP